MKDFYISVDHLCVSIVETMSRANLVSCMTSLNEEN